MAPDPSAPVPTVRRLGAGDTEAWRALRLESLRLAPRAFAADFETEAAEPVTTFADRIARGVVFGAFAGATMAGCAVFWQGERAKSAHIGYLVGLYVSAPLRRRGAGDALVAAILSHAQGRVLQVHLGVAADNMAARRLYERHGFVVYGTEPRSLRVYGEFVDEHLMVRFLDRPDRGD